jgi:hypothetical protein
MKKTKFYKLLIVTCTASALLGIALGYFVFGPIGVSARTGAANPPPETAEERKIEKITTEPLLAYVNYDTKSAQEFEPDREPTTPAHRFIVTSKDGVIVVYHAGEKSEIKEVTLTPVNALPPEEQERLAQGILIYTEEALIRILEDYGS